MQLEKRAECMEFLKQYLEGMTPFFVFGDRMVKYGRCQGVPNEVTHDVWSKDVVLYIKSQISDKIALMAFFQKDVGHHAIQDGY